jgi:hypothetical protein
MFCVFKENHQPSFMVCNCSPATQEAEVRGLLEHRSLRPAIATQGNLVSQCVCVGGGCHHLNPKQSLGKHRIKPGLALHNDFI